MEKTRLISLGITAIIILVASFAMINNLVGVETVQSPGPATPSAHSGQAPVYGYKVVKVYPHNTSAFTEGLLFHDGYLYESTGVYGNSSLRKVDLSTGKVLRIKRLPDWVFGRIVSSSSPGDQVSGSFTTVAASTRRETSDTQMRAGG